MASSEGEAFAAKRRRTGGQRQRIQRAAERDAPSVKSVFAEFLLKMFAWGTFSPQQVQSMAALVVQDIQTAEEKAGRLVELERLAELGTHGQYPNHIHGDLMGKIKTTSNIQPTYYETLTFKSPVGPARQGFLLPHETFATIYHNYPKTWERSVLPNTEALADFWQSVEEHPQMLNHPVTKRRSFASKAIPFGFHGDGVPITGVGKVWQKLMTVFSFSSMIATGATLDVCFYIWAVFDKMCVSGEEGTMNTFFKILRWSFFWLWMGKWPDEDWKGNKNLV